MKVLTFNRLCILVALVLGLVCAWSNAVPKVTNGDTFGGANCGCQNDLDWDCHRALCLSTIEQCHNEGTGAWDCQPYPYDHCLDGKPGDNCEEWVGDSCQ